MPDNHPLRSGTKEDVVKQYLTLFQGLSKLEGEHTIHLKEGATPFCLTTPRQTPLPLMKKVQEKIKRMEQLDVIEPIDEPTEWCSPIVVVPKADGRVRICIDLTRLKRRSLKKSIKCQQLKRHWEASQKDRYSPNSMLTQGFTR